MELVGGLLILAGIYIASVVENRRTAVMPSPD